MKKEKEEKEEKEKIIQIAYAYNGANPTLLTNKGRLFIVSYANPAHPEWIDLKINIEIIK